MTKVFQIWANMEGEWLGTFAFVIMAICIVLRVVWKIIKENKSINITKDPDNKIDELTIGPKGSIKLKKSNQASKVKEEETREERAIEDDVEKEQSTKKKRKKKKSKQTIKSYSDT